MLNCKKPYLYNPLKKGRMAERLGSALQKLLHRFESGSDLLKIKRPDRFLNLSGRFILDRPEVSGLLDRFAVRCETVPSGLLDLDTSVDYLPTTKEVV